MTREKLLSIEHNIATVFWRVERWGDGDKEQNVEVPQGF